jgi:calcium-dependent protein kinase
MIKEGQYSFESPVWKQVSDNGKDFIAGLLKVDPNDRMTVEQIQNHPWYLGDFESKGDLD